MLFIGFQVIACRWAEQTGKGYMWEVIGLSDWHYLIAAKSGASYGSMDTLAEELVSLINVWPDLPENIKQPVQLLAQPSLVSNRSNWS